MIVGIDGDDTLWHTERVFAEAEDRVRVLLDQWVDPSQLDDRLLDTERRNLATFGYGVKSFTLSLIETAIEMSGGQVPADVIAELLREGKRMLDHPVELLDGVLATVPRLAQRWRLVLITKGDLFHQESKLARSGLLPHFDHVEIVSEKDAATYGRVLARLGIDPVDFVMIGDSVRSDVAPVLALGGRAVHIPGYREWELERATIAPDAGEWRQVPSIREVPELLAGWD